jgi:hypothetical protein
MVVNSLGRWASSPVLPDFVLRAAPGAPNVTKPELIGFGGDESIFSGFARNLSKHPAQQKK